MVRHNQLRRLPVQSLKKIKTLSLLWLEGNPLPRDLARNVGGMQLPDPDSVEALLQEYETWETEHLAEEAANGGGSGGGSFSGGTSSFYGQTVGKSAVVTKRLTVTVVEGKDLPAFDNNGLR